MRSFRSLGSILITVVTGVGVAACSDDNSGDDDDTGGDTTAGVDASGDSATGTGTGGSNSATGSGGTQSLTASSNSTGTTASGATSGSTSGSGAASNGSSDSSTSASNGTSGGSVFDGGTVPLTDEEADEILGGACTGWASEGEAIPSVLMLVVDVSASMGLQAPGTNQSKWEVTRTALTDAIVGEGLGSGLPGSVAVGMLLYPNTPDDTPSTPGAKDIDLCVGTDKMIPVAPLGAPDSEHRSLIRDTLLGNVPLRYGTPTHDAYWYATNFGLLPSEAPGERFMVLITDGAPTVSRECQNENPNWTDVDPWPIVDTVENAYQLGVKTFFIGSPGSDDSSLSLMRDNRIWMSEAAFVGGTAFEGCQLEGPAFCHMDMTQATNFSTALREGLGAIAGQVAPCTYSYADPPQGFEIDDDEINVVVEYDGQSTLVVRDDIGDCTEGWQLTSNGEIRLCPSTCSTVQLDPNITVRVAFGCESLLGPLG